MKRFLPLIIIPLLFVITIVAIGSYMRGIKANRADSAQRTQSLEDQLSDADSKLDLLSHENKLLKEKLEQEKARSESKTQTIAELQRQLAETMQKMVDSPEVPVASFEEKIRALLSRLAGDDAWYYRDKLIEMGEEVIPFILARLEDADVTDAESLLLYQVLARFSNPELVPWFIAGLASDNGRVRRECQRALARLTYQNLPADYDEWALWYAANAGLDPAYWYSAAMEDVFSDLASDNSRDRSDALTFLFRQLMSGDEILSSDPRLAAALGELAQDDSALVRRRVLTMMAQILTDDELIDYVVPMLTSSDSVMERTGAIMALGRPGLTGAVSSLESLLNDSNPTVKRTAFLSLARIGGDAAKEKLNATLAQAKQAGEDTRSYEFILNAMEEGRLDSMSLFGMGRTPGGDPRGNQGGGPPGFWGARGRR
jgi:HEAT repeat protein